MGGTPESIRTLEGQRALLRIAQAWYTNPPKSGGEVPRLMNADAWSRHRQRLERRFRDHVARGASQRPLLYTTRPGEYTVSGMFGQPKSVRSEYLIEVLRDGTAYAWIFVPRNPHPVEQRRYRVRNLGGVPDPPVLLFNNADYPPRPLLDCRIDVVEGDMYGLYLQALCLREASLNTVSINPDTGWLGGPDPVAEVIPLKISVRRHDRLGIADTEEPSRDVRRVPPPEPRLVRDAREAEELAARWVAWLGWPDAAPTQYTSDEGVDVLGKGALGIAVAQVKFEALPAGRPVLQGLFGAGHGVGATTWMCFTSAGYTAQAIAWADRVGMALFRFSFDGSIEPANPDAARLFEH